MNFRADQEHNQKLQIKATSFFLCIFQVFLKASDESNSPDRVLIWKKMMTFSLVGWKGIEGQFGS